MGVGRGGGNVCERVRRPTPVGGPAPRCTHRILMSCSAILIKAASTFSAVRADVSRKGMPSSRASPCPSPSVTTRSVRSHLFPISSLHVSALAYLSTSTSHSRTWLKDSCGGGGGDDEREGDGGGERGVRRPTRNVAACSLCAAGRAEDAPAL
jgi:hypothetical protein